MPLHVTQRGNNRTAIFRSPDDFKCFLAILRESSRRSQCAIHAYVLMPNHVHLLTTPKDKQGLARMMQAVGRRFTQYVNARYARTGTLWEGRYHSSLVHTDRYALTCSRYIENNPVRAGMTKDAGLYPWSSYRHNALGFPDQLIIPQPLYRALGPRLVDRQTAYRALFEDDIEPQELDAIRQAAKSGEILGDDGFRQIVETSLHRSLTRPPHGGDRRSKAFKASKTPDVAALSHAFQAI
jgi:putative transposase